MSQQEKPEPTAVVEIPRNPQLDLFANFVSNDPDEVTNTVEIWDSIPKFSINKNQAAKHRQANGLAEPIEFSWVSNERTFVMVLSPAMIKQPDGSFQACFPSKTEEFVEEALKKIFTEQHHGFHEVGEVRSWVYFTRRMIYQELKKRGCTRSVDEINHALEVLSKCNLSISRDGKEVWNGPVISDLTAIDRQQYLETPLRHSVCRLSVFISRAINELEYRQIQMDTLLSLKSDLARWLYRKMANRYTQANVGNQYQILLSTIQAESNLLNSSPAKNREKCAAAWDELDAKHVLLGWERHDKKRRKRIVDVLYKFTPSPEFSYQQKAANARVKKGRTTAATLGGRFTG